MAYLIPTLLVLVSSLLIPTTISANPLYTLCSQNYTKNGTTDTYTRNLHNLLNDLYKNASATGFGTSSTGHGYDKVFGLSLCRGDVPRYNCSACINKAKYQINKRCPSSKEAIIWYDNCYLKYSNDSFFGKIDNHNVVIMWNLNNASDPQAFYNTAMGLLDRVSINCSSSNKRMFAGGCQKNENETIYGMAQCSRDLTPENCKQCLGYAVKTLPRISVVNETVTSIPVGGRTLTGSCIVRYETYNFLDQQEEC